MEFVVFQLDSWMGQLVCAFGVGLGAVTGHSEDAANLCLFIVTNDL